MEGLSYVIFIVLTALAALAVASVIRGMFKKPVAKDAAAAEATVKPFVDYPPPDAVVRTPGVVRIGTLALIWGVLNLGAVVVGVATGFDLGERLSDVGLVLGTAAAYVVIASLFTSWGGVLLLSAQANGRRMLSWGGFLFATLGTLAIGVALLMWLAPESDVSTRPGARTAAFVLVVHLAIDTVLAAMAQRVGLPPQSPQAAPTPGGQEA